MLQDPIAGRYHRFSPTAHFVISLMDGTRTLQKIWETAVAQLGDDAPTQDETIQLLGQLHSSNVLSTNVPPDTLELFERFEKQSWQDLKQKLISPLSIKVPLLDPEKVLSRFEKWVRLFFSPFGAVLWGLVLMASVVMGGIHWNEFTQNISSTVLSPGNLFLIWLLFPLVKALHELGHAFATKVWGGEVHEMGVMLLVFIPVPYVDASAASAFRERYKRVIVGAAGMMAELFVAAIAMVVWINTDPGLARSLAYNTILIAGVSTLLFNANPLLRFDGYYILADFLEIPNLAGRANQYVAYLVQKYAFGVHESRSPATAPGERKWFLFFSCASYIYRLFITVAIALFVAGKFFFVGICLAILAVANMFLFPLLKGVAFVLKNGKLQRHRLRANSVTWGTLALVVAGICLIPLPSWTNAEGVVWLPENTSVRAGSECFVTDIVATPDQLVAQGDVLIQCQNDDLYRDLAAAKARYKEAGIKHVSQWRTDPLAADLTRIELQTLEKEIERIQEKIAELSIKSPSTGRFSVPLAQDLQGRYMTKGQVLGYVIQDHDITIRAVVTQANIELVRSKTENVQLVFADKPEQVFDANILREVPGAEKTLPSPALGSVAGGAITVDPRAEGGTKTFERIFQFDIALSQPVTSNTYGGRTYIRFLHQRESLAVQWYRKVRKLFLDEFSV